MANLIVDKLNKSFGVQTGALFFEKSRVQALNNVSFQLPDLESLGIVGESGSGKTTLAKILAGFLDADQGTAALDQHDLLSLDRFNRAHFVQMVFQDPYSSVNPKLLLHTQLFEAIKLVSSVAVQHRAHELMTAVGLPTEFLNRYPHQLSGGQRQRFALARALARKPSLLIADEPVSSLDVTVQAQIITLLKRLKSELKFSLMIISHDLAVVAQLCDRIIVMKSGCIIEEGNLKKIISKPDTKYTAKLISATPTLD